MKLDEFKVGDLVTYSAKGSTCIGVIIAFHKALNFYTHFDNIEVRWIFDGGQSWLTRLLKDSFYTHSLLRKLG